MVGVMDLATCTQNQHNNTPRFFQEHDTSAFKMPERLTCHQMKNIEEPICLFLYLTRQTNLLKTTPCLQTSIRFHRLKTTSWSSWKSRGSSSTRKGSAALSLRISRNSPIKFFSTVCGSLPPDLQYLSESSGSSSSLHVYQDDAMIELKVTRIRLNHKGIRGSLPPNLQ